MTGDFDIGAPGPGSDDSDRFRNTDHIGHLVAYVQPLEDKIVISDKETRVAHCDFVICTSCIAVWEDARVSGAAMVPRLLSSGHAIVLCSTELGPAKEGKNPAVLPLDPIPEEIAAADSIFGQFAHRFPSGKIGFDVPAYLKTKPAQ
jgi:hypothetical protein